MMSFYFIDDDKNITNILKLIVNTRGLGVCCGSAENAAEALADLPVMRPDIVLVDFLMPEMDGISFIKQAKKILPDAAYIFHPEANQQRRSGIHHPQSQRRSFHETDGSADA